MGESKAGVLNQCLALEPFSSAARPHRHSPSKALALPVVLDKGELAPCPRLVLRPG